MEIIIWRECRTHTQERESNVKKSLSNPDLDNSGAETNGEGAGKFQYPRHFCATIVHIGN
jgi:hypothetical protein